MDKKVLLISLAALFFLIMLISIDILLMKKSTLEPEPIDAGALHPEGEYVATGINIEDQYKEAADYVVDVSLEETQEDKIYKVIKSVCDATGYHFDAITAHGRDFLDNIELVYFTLSYPQKPLKEYTIYCVNDTLYTCVDSHVEQEAEENYNYAAKSPDDIYALWDSQGGTEVDVASCSTKEARRDLVINTALENTAYDLYRIDDSFDVQGNRVPMFLFYAISSDDSLKEYAIFMISDEVWEYIDVEL